MSELSQYRQGGSIQGATIRSPYVPLPGELSPKQRQLAKALASSMLLPAAGFGFVSAGECRRRWLGLLPPRAPDKMVTLELDKKKTTLPFWKAWAELQARNVWGDPISPPLDGMLTKQERWEVMIEAAAGSYGAFKGRMMAYRSEQIEQEVRAVGQSAQITKTCIRLANDLAARFDAAEREGSPIRAPSSLVMSGLLLLPLVRSGHELKPQWDVLLRVGEEPVERELLNAVPPERREALAKKNRALREALAQAK